MGVAVLILLIDCFVVWVGLLPIVGGFWTFPSLDFNCCVCCDGCARCWLFIFGFSLGTVL